MIEKVFDVTGEKISSMVLDENEIKFSSKGYQSLKEFQDAWPKKITLATKNAVEYQDIKSIKKEINDEEVVIKCKGIAGMSIEYKFSFNEEADVDVFFDYFERKLLFQKNQVTLTPFKAASSYLLGLGITIAATVFGYYEAIALANGEGQIEGRKGRLLVKIIETLGVKGVIIVGALFAVFFSYQIYSRIKNRPNQWVLTPL